MANIIIALVKNNDGSRPSRRSVSRVGFSRVFHLRGGDPFGFTPVCVGYFQRGPAKGCYQRVDVRVDARARSCPRTGPGPLEVELQSELHRTGASRADDGIASYDVGCGTSAAEPCASRSVIA